jgi:DNA-binding GntR family transcriptional regulator
MSITETTFVFEAVEPPTLKAKVAGQIQDAVLDGSLRPGARIVESRMAKELGVAQTTVREAIQDLVNVGLLIKRVNRDSLVRELTPADMEKLFRVRAELEGLVVELAHPLVTKPSLEPLEEAVEGMRRAAQSGKMPEFYRFDMLFHRLLSRLAKNEFLDRAMVPLSIAPVAFVLSGAQAPLKTNYVQVANDHLDILAAFSLKTPKQARAAVDAKLQHWHRLQSRGTR